jgi:hypothetical protein
MPDENRYPRLPKTLLIGILSVLCIQVGYSQSRSGIGLAYGINKPLSNDYNTGSGFQFLGKIAIGNSWAIIPDLGYDRLNSKGRVFYDPANFNNKRIGSVDLFHLGLSGRYFFNKQWFANAGAIVYAGGGNEDIANAGIGGSAAAGYNLNLDEHSSLELSLNTSIINIQYSDNNVTPIIGLKVAYVFNFRRDD